MGGGGAGRGRGECTYIYLCKLARRRLFRFEVCSLTAVEFIIGFSNLGCREEGGSIRAVFSPIQFYAEVEVSTAAAET